jgi:hypothetical protein
MGIGNQTNMVLTRMILSNNGSAPEFQIQKDISMPIPISLLIDDGAPVNLMFFHDPPVPHDLLLPNALARDFADLCAAFGVRGKFSVLPMPAGLGSIDDSLNLVPRRHLQTFLDTVRTRIAPRFDITPEVLTHLCAYRVDKGGFTHLYEDEWVARASVDEMTDYFALAFEILRDAGLPANGMTSPWSTGKPNEHAYVQAIAAAQWRVHRRLRTWYFLHCLGDAKPRAPWIAHRDCRTGQVVASVPALTHDPFWNTQRPMAVTRRAARAAARAGVDTLLGADGTSGRIPEIIAAGCPVTLLTHWQSLYSDGTCAGLEGLALLFARLQQRYGADLQWCTCSELAKRAGEAAARDRYPLRGHPVKLASDFNRPVAQ